MFALHIDKTNSKVVVQENDRTHFLDFMPGIWSVDDYYDHWGQQGYEIFDGFHGVGIFFLSMPPKGSRESTPVFRVMRGNSTVFFCYTEIVSPWDRSDVDSAAQDLVSLINSSKDKFSSFIVYDYRRLLIPDFAVKIEDYVKWHQGEFPCEYDRPELHNLFVDAGVR